MTVKENKLKHVTLDGVRIHLKTDENKLWINSKYVLFLNDTTTFILESMIDCYYKVSKEKVPEETVKKMLEKYNVTKEQAQQDFDAIIGIINSFARDEIPDNMVGTEVITNENLTAPNRMDISLTYDCNNECHHCYLKENKNKDGTLTTEQWKEIIDKLWKIGIPQIVFTGGEVFLKKDDIIELAEYSKKFVCGIITNGTLITSEIAKELKRVELDWIQITLESATESIHDEMVGRKGAWKETVQGIKNCINAEVPTSINTTLTKKNCSELDLSNLIIFCKTLGVEYLSTNAIINSGRGIKAKKDIGVSEKELSSILKKAKDQAECFGIGFNWFLPTCYKNLNPMDLGFGQRCCSACSVNMMVQPEGSVIPCQSWIHETLGNIITDDWETIWNHPTAKKLRNYEFNKIISYAEASDGMTQSSLEKTKNECIDCEYENLCHGACPLDKINSESDNNET